MNSATPWYTSHAIWGCVAAILVAIATHFNIGLPADWTKDQITDFFLQVVPIAIAIHGRVTAKSVITLTPSKAAAINAAAAPSA